MKKLILSAAILAATAHAACPISECNYLDPHYKAAYDAWMNCTSVVVDQFTHAMDTQAILYPRFGIAWRAQKSEMDAARDLAPEAVSAAVEEAHRRFEDRILRTAEPEALEFYNLWGLKVKQQAERCGPMPEPPRGQP